MEVFIKDLVHFLVPVMVVAFLFFVVLLGTNRLTYEFFGHRQKIVRAKTGAFLTPLIFSELDHESFSRQIEEFRKTVPFQEKWCKELILNSLINLKQNLKGDITQNIHFIYERFGFFEVSLGFLKDRRWYIKCIGLYHFQALEYTKGGPYVRHYLKSKNKILASSAYIALVSLTSDKLDFLIDYEHSIPLTTEIKIMDILHSRKPPMPQNLSQWIQSGNTSVIRLGLKFMVYYNYLGAGKEILLLLHSNNPEIRREVFFTVRELFIEGAEEALIWQFDHEQKRNKIAILYSLGAIGTEISERFLTRLLRAENENDIKMAAVKSLYEINADFASTHFSDNSEIYKMIKHVKDPYL